MVTNAEMHRVIEAAIQSANRIADEVREAPFEDIRIDRLSKELATPVEMLKIFPRVLNTYYLQGESGEFLK